MNSSNSKNRLIIVSEYYYPVITSTGYFVTEIAEYLAQKKMEVVVVCTNSKYQRSDSESFIKNEKHNDVLIYRIITITLNKNDYLARTIKLFLSSIQLFIKILKIIKKNDSVLVVTNPAFLLLLMPFLKILRNIEYSILVHDVFPENLIAIGTINPKSILSRLLKTMFDSAYAKSKRLIVLGRDMKKIVESKVKGHSSLSVITNWAETETLIPKCKLNTKIIRDLKLENKFIFQFAGNIGLAQGIDNILSAIKTINNENIHFLFIGSGALENEVIKFSNNSSLKNVTVIGFQPREQQHDFLNACDVAIVTLNDGMYGLGVPSKSYNIMAVGKPILMIGDENSEISLTIMENNIGWVIPPNKPQELANCIENIYQNYIKGSWNLSDSRNVAENLYAKEKILEKYYNLFN